MKTMSVGGGTARECPAAKEPFQTTAHGGSDRVRDNRGSIAKSRTHDGGYGARTVNKFEALQVREHGGFQWTGSAFPLRIPTTWKVRARKLGLRLFNAISYIRASDIAAFAAITVVVGLVWYALGPLAG